MAQKNTTASQPSVAEIMKQQELFAARQQENFAKGEKALKQLKDLNVSSVTQSVPTINRETLRNYFSNVGGFEKQLREAARYLYHRSNVFMRIVHWYCSMFSLNCRKVTPAYNLVKSNNANKAKKSLNDTFDALDRLNFKNSLFPALLNVFVEDVFYGVRYTDDSGTIIIPIPQEFCQIDGQYMTGDFSYSVDILRLARNKQWKVAIEFLGEPFESMIKEAETQKLKWINMPDKYCVCLKYDTKDINIVIPPLARIMLQLSALEDNVDIQAVADELSIFKLVYLPLDTLSGAKDSDDFKVSPDLAVQYFNNILESALPKYVSGGVIPGQELKTIDFSQSSDNDINRVESATDNILATSGGGGVLNMRYLNSIFAFKMWVYEETSFALDPLLPQIEGLTNRVLAYEVSNPAKVTYFKVSPYTKQDLADRLLSSCQYSFADRLAYQTLLGFSEKETLASLYMENELLGLQNLMIYPLQSSYTTAGGESSEGGRPETPDEELTDSGERTRNR